MADLTEKQLRAIERVRARRAPSDSSPTGGDNAVEEEGGGVMSRILGGAANMAQGATLGLFDDAVAHSNALVGGMTGYMPSDEGMGLLGGQDASDMSYQDRVDYMHNQFDTGMEDYKEDATALEEIALPMAGAIAGAPAALGKGAFNLLRPGSAWGRIGTAGAAGAGEGAAYGVFEGQNSLPEVAANAAIGGLTGVVGQAGLGEAAPRVMSALTGSTTAKQTVDALSLAGERISTAGKKYIEHAPSLTAAVNRAAQVIPKMDLSHDPAKNRELLKVVADQANRARADLDNSVHTMASSITDGQSALARQAQHQADMDTAQAGYDQMLTAIGKNPVSADGVKRAINLAFKQTPKGTKTKGTLQGAEKNIYKQLTERAYAMIDNANLTGGDLKLQDASMLYRQVNDLMRTAAKGTDNKSKHNYAILRSVKNRLKDTINAGAKGDAFEVANKRYSDALYKNDAFKDGMNAMGTKNADVTSGWLDQLPRRETAKPDLADLNLRDEFINGMKARAQADMEGPGGMANGLRRLLADADNPAKANRGALRKLRYMTDDETTEALAREYPKLAPAEKALTNLDTAIKGKIDTAHVNMHPGTVKNMLIIGSMLRNPRPGMSGAEASAVSDAAGFGRPDQAFGQNLSESILKTLAAEGDRFSDPLEAIAREFGIGPNASYAEAAAILEAKGLLPNHLKTAGASVTGALYGNETLDLDNLAEIPKQALQAGQEAFGNEVQ